MPNYIEDLIFEDSASRDMLSLVGQKEFNWVAERIKAFDSKIESKKIDSGALDALDCYFPIFDLEGAFDYLFKCAVIGNDQKLKEWVEKQKEKIHGN